MRYHVHPEFKWASLSSQLSPRGPGDRQIDASFKRVSGFGSGWNSERSVAHAEMKMEVGRPRIYVIEGAVY